MIGTTKSLEGKFQGNYTFVGPNLGGNLGEQCKIYTNFGHCAKINELFLQLYLGLEPTYCLICTYCWLQDQNTNQRENSGFGVAECSFSICIALFI
jgi:hypothetical protein